VDCTHPKIKSGDVDQTPRDLFHEQFSKAIRAFLLTSPNSLILIIPSVLDIISDHAAFPQSGLSPEFTSDPVCTDLLSKVRS
jgi:DNA polymerase alpha subunit B